MTLVFLVATGLLLGPVSNVYARGTWRWAYPRLALVGWWLLGISSLSTLTLACLWGELPIGFHFSRIVHASTYRELTGFGAVVLSLWINVAVGLVVSIMIRAIKSWRDRRHHRRILDLLSPPVRNTIRLPHEAPLAYYLPGGRGRVVLSDGLFDQLGVDANVVIAHEHAHRQQCHSPLLLPFASASHHLHHIAFFRFSTVETPLLVECAADDYAAARWGVESLQRALSHLSSGAMRTPTCAMAMSDLALDLRRGRLAREFRPTGLVTSMTAVVVAAVVPSVGLLFLH